MQTIGHTIYMNPSYFSVIPQYDRNNNYNGNSTLFNSLPSNNQHNGNISEKGIKRLKNAFSWLIYYANVRKNNKYCINSTKKLNISFLTLTLPSPQVHSDNYVKSKMLHNFFIELEQKHLFTNYIWKAEKQKNGNIHFHICFDSYINWFIIRTIWNRILKKENYIQRFKEIQTNLHANGFNYNPDLFQIKKVNGQKIKFKVPYDVQKQRYEKNFETNFENPNSIDIKKVKNFRGAASYFAKYFSKPNIDENETKEEKNDEKNPQKTPNKINMIIKGRLWFLSKGLSTLKNVCFDLNSEIQKELEILKAKYFDKCIQSDFFEVFCFDLDSLIREKCFNLLAVFRRQIDLINSQKTLF